MEFKEPCRAQAEQDKSLGDEDGQQRSVRIAVPSSQSSDVL